MTVEGGGVGREVHLRQWSPTHAPAAFFLDPAVALTWEVGAKNVYFHVS